MIISRAIPLIIIALFVGCATPQQQAQVQQPQGATLVAGIGDVILSIKRTSDLPNAFGGADIFGRRKAEGEVEVRFLGVSEGQVVLARNDTDITSDETTMTRGGGLILPNQSTTAITGRIGTTPVVGSATTTGGYTYIPSRPTETRVRETGWITINLSAERGSKAIVSGQTIEIIQATPRILRYRIE